jgi:hypothetical protein
MNRSSAQTGENWQLPYLEFKDMLLFRHDFEEDGTRWSEYSDLLGNIVLSRSLFHDDEDGFWDSLYREGKQIRKCKYLHNNNMYEDHVYIYSHKTNKLTKIEVYSPDRQIIRIIDPASWK